MGKFEIAVLALLVLQALLLLLVARAIRKVGEDLSFKLDVINGSLNLVLDRQVGTQVAIQQGFDRLERPARIVPRDY